MNAKPRELSALLGPALAAVVSLVFAGAPSAPPRATPRPTPASACQSLGGQLAEHPFGAWDCGYQAGSDAPRFESSLVEVCTTTPDATRVEDVVASRTFYCPPVLLT